MSVVLRAVRDHADREIRELEAERDALLEKAAERSRRIATLQAMTKLAAEHAAAEDNSDANGKETT